MPFRDVVGHAGSSRCSRARSTRGVAAAEPDLRRARRRRQAARRARRSRRRSTAIESWPTEPPTASATDSTRAARCAACTRIARGVHPDVLVVEPGDSGAIKIDQVRDIVDRAATGRSKGAGASSSSTRRTRWSPPAQNALLKTLEEPPSASVFMLVTARPDVLLPTVRSRCPRLRFRPLGADDVARR